MVRASVVVLVVVAAVRVAVVVRCALLRVGAPRRVVRITLHGTGGQSRTCESVAAQQNQERRNVPGCWFRVAFCPLPGREAIEIESARGKDL